jgi:outer membrane protein with beta-barrel domain
MRWLPIVLLSSSAAFADEPENRDEGARFYAGLGAASLTYEGEHRGVEFDDSSIGLDAYGGFRLRDNLAIEVSYKSFDAVEIDDIRGSGVAHLDITSGWDTQSVTAVAEVSLQEWFRWKRNWRVYGTLGYYRSDIDRTVVTLGTGANESVSDDESGLLLGTGVLYEIGIVDLRGYIEWFGVLDDREAWDAGVAVQVSF